MTKGERRICCDVCLLSGTIPLAALPASGSQGIISAVPIGQAPLCSGKDTDNNQYAKVKTKNHSQPNDFSFG